MAGCAACSCSNKRGTLEYSIERYERVLVLYRVYWDW